MAVIDGTSGNDTLNGTSEADTITGFEGDDTVNTGTRPTDGQGDFVDGGTGIDTLIVDCSGESQSVSLGVAGAPTFFVRSTSNNFYVDAYNIEKVQFTGGSGDDSINTGSGGVSVNGNGGIDLWTADLGALTSNVNFVVGSTTSIAAAGLVSILDIERIALTTGSGNDAITGGSQADSITTGLGNDTVDMKTRPVSGNGDFWDGGAGLDTLIVDASTETQSVSLGVAGAPTFFVRSTSNNFYVDAYNVEKVKFTGGTGDDSINTGSGGVTVDGGAGTDLWLADFSAITSGISFALGTTTAIGAAGLTSILHIERLSLVTGVGNDSIVGGAEADSLQTGDGNDTVDLKTRPVAGNGDFWDAGAGTDTLIVDASAETQSVHLGVSGAPTFFVRSVSNNFYVDAYNAEKVKFTGGSGDDAIDTGNHAATLDGGAGIDSWSADLSAVNSNITFILGTTTAINAGGLTSILGIEQISLTTGAGNDAITGGAQADVLYSNAGNDTADLRTRPVAGNGDFWDGGAGNDTLVVDASAETQAVSLGVGGAPTFFVRSTSNNFFVDAYNVEKVKFTGGSGGDSINTGNGAITVDGGAGIDTWIADYSATNKAIVFRLASTSAISAVGLNSIANFERMNLTTGGGNDTITGYGFDDIIVTGAGDDIVDAGMHNAGGGGLDFVDGGAGNDLLIVDASGEVLGVQLFSGGAPSFSVRSTTDRLSVDAYNMESVKFTGGAGNDLANGGGGKDILAGGLGSDTLNGGGAGDTISGNAGSDTIDGGDGLDTIDAGKDADTLHGGAGADQLTGGGQADVFLYDLKSDSTIANSDTITDFQVGLDDIDLSDLDADSTSGGLQHFTFIASAAFSGVAGELRAVAGTVEADINGDGTADFRILIGNGATLGAGDFILS